MVRLPGGVFMMGANNGVKMTGPRGLNHETPVHEVELSPFWIDQYAVTNKDFAKFVAATGFVTYSEKTPDLNDFTNANPELLVPASIVFKQPTTKIDTNNYLNWWEYKPGANWLHPEGPSSDILNRDTHPVVHVTFEDAKAYCEWQGKSLPTEAQWEYAARGGLPNKNYVWGDDPIHKTQNIMNYWRGEFPYHNDKEPAPITTMPVGSFAPNDFNLYDMAGNVWEWVADWYHPRYYEVSPRKNPTGVKKEHSLDPNQPGIPKKVVRGGSFLCSENFCTGFRPSARMATEPLASSNHIGFRCVKNIQDINAALPSWQDGKTKQSIIDFVKAVTDPNSKDFVPEENRIAVFDNDGTLWSEKPMYFQLLFAKDQMQKMAAKHPKWQENKFFKAIIEDNLDPSYPITQKDVLDLTIATHADLSQQEFEQKVLDWIKTATHPVTQRKYTDMVYAPMLEVLEYLAQHGFKNYIVSGGGVDFIRVWSNQIYKILPEQVIGSTIQREFVLENGQANLKRLPKINNINDGEYKTINIADQIGQRPIAAFGNSDGDLQMLQWTTSGSGKRLGVLVHHTDAKREWAYDKQSSVGKLDRGLKEAITRGWTIIDMQNDWKKIYRD